jgi:hypothetical protein
LGRANFARFDAKLEQRLAEARAELRTEMHAGFAAQHSASADLRAEMAAGLTGLRSELIKWMFIFWAGSVVSTVGLVFAVVSLL